MGSLPLALLEEGKALLEGVECLLRRAIGLRALVDELEEANRLVDAHHPHAVEAAEDKIIPCLVSGGLAHEDPGTVLLVHALEAGGEVHRVPHHRVVHLLRRTHVADDHLAGVDADARVKRIGAEVLLGDVLVENALHLLHADGAEAGPCGVVGVLHRRAEEGDDGVALVFVDGAALVEDDVTHLGEIAVEELHQIGRVEVLRYRRETFDIGEECGEVLLLPAEVELRGVGEQVVYDIC